MSPATGEVEWQYVDEATFWSPFRAGVQRLPNGNTLICESAGKRVFEVTPGKQVVWEYVEGSPRAYRYAYDHCPQSAALGVPKEVSVTPPRELRIEPDEPLDG